MDVANFADKLSDRLSPSEMGQGIAVANRNARRLLGDAILLYEAGSFPSATALAVLAMEESVKWWTLVQATVLLDRRAIRGVWHHHRAHQPKLDKVISIVMGAYEAGGGVRGSAATSDLARITQAMKERCIYSEFVAGRRWIEPSRVCDAGESKNHLAVALIMLTGYHVTGRRIGSIFDQIAGRLIEPQEEAAKQAMIAWSAGEEATALAADDDAENESLRVDARRRLRLDSLSV